MLLKRQKALSDSLRRKIASKVRHCSPLLLTISQLRCAFAAVVPKANVTFSFNLPLASKEPGVEKALAFELHGSNFAFRSSDRANKKFKPKGAKGLDY